MKRKGQISQFAFGDDDARPRKVGIWPVVALILILIGVIFLGYLMTSNQYTTSEIKKAIDVDF